MRAIHTNRARRSRAGYSFLELSVSVTLFVVVLLSSLALIERDTQLSRSVLGIATVETMSQEMIFGIEQELANAQAESPVAVLSEGIDGQATELLRVDSTLGFPPSGILVLDRGTASEEWIRYEDLSADQTAFLRLERGVGCTAAQAHDWQSEALWSGLAEALFEQDSPPDGSWDGRAEDLAGGIFFRGLGTGVSYRIPVDPNYTPGDIPDYLDGDELRWGQVIEGVGNEDGWAAIEFVPSWVFDEGATNDDINNDGDFNDVFDVGQLRRRIWNAWDPTDPIADLGLGPTAVLQERCNWGGDLDSDGFEDPIFCWDPEQRLLHLKLKVIGTSVDDMPVIRTVESTYFLRNEQEF